MNGQTRQAPYPPSALWHAMADAAPTPMVLISITNGLVLYSNRMGGLLAHDPAAIMSVPAGQAFPAPIAAAIEQVRRSGHAVHQRSLRLPPASHRAEASLWDIAYTPIAGEGTGETPGILLTAHDVTHHERARQDAEQARNTLDALLAHIPEGITIAYGPNVHVERVSAAGIEMARRPSHDLVGRDALKEGAAWDVYRPGEDTPIPPEGKPMARAIGSGAVTLNETLVMRRPDGTEIPLLCSAGPIRSSDGVVIGAVLCWRDITELLAAQEAVTANEIRLRAVLQQIPAAVLVVDSADGVAPFKNDRLAQVLGNPSLSNKEARQTLRGWALHQDGTPYRLEEYPSRRAFSQGEMIEAEPMIYRKPDGQIIELEVFAGPIRDARGQIMAAVGVVHDVTERQRQADALREGEERLRIAIEAGGLATWEIDVVNGTTQMDATFSKLLGLPAKTFRGSRDEARRFIHPEDIDRARAALEAAIACKGELQVETRAIAADGRVLWLAYSGRVVLDHAERPLRVAGVVRDVTEQRRREEALQRAVAAQELLVREADHRIKNSLQLVCNVLTLQKTRLSRPDLDAALDGAIARVQAVAEAHRALHQSVDLRTVDFGTMLNDLCQHAERLSPATRFDCQCPAQIDLDAERAIPLGLILSELLTNAAKYAYGAEGGPVAVSAALAAGQITIRVADQGRGIPAEAQTGRGIGSRIIGAIAKQIHATVETASGPAGTTVMLSFAQQNSA